mmetsp:Transcript_4751/g.11601  ORF Transcript_4751/g.11601 Transcript_4751/m.11601 type:complete len:182 (+) Transcript_4751:117-662(+)
MPSPVDIDTFKLSTDVELLECAPWLAGKYVMLSESSGFLESLLEEKQVPRAVKHLRDDRSFYDPLGGKDLIESAFCLGRYDHRKPAVKKGSWAKVMQLGKGDVTTENVRFFLEKLAELLREKGVPEEERRGFLRYVMFVGRNVAEASSEGEKTKVSTAELKALNEIAAIFEIEPIQKHEYK